MNRRAMAWLIGIGLLFVGERSFQGGARWVLDGLGGLLLCWALAQHHAAIGRATSPNRAYGHRMAFRLSLVALRVLAGVLDGVGLGHLEADDVTADLHIPDVSAQQ